MPAGADSDSNDRRVGRGFGFWLRQAAAVAAALVALAALALLATHVFLPQRTGPLVFSQIFEPYLLAGALFLLLVLALLARRRWPTLLMLLLVCALAARYGPQLVSFPAPVPEGAQELHVMSWNLEAGEVSAADIVETVERIQPDIVGLIELTPARSRATEDHARIQDLYPYRVMLPRSGEPGLGMLSRFPVLEHEFTQDPPFLRAVITPSVVEPPLIVFVAHPYLDGIDVLGLVPDVQTARRDAHIRAIRAQIDADLAAGRDVLVLGDFNVTEREPAYAELAGGLHDAQREAGFGLGLTWRPGRIDNLPFGLLRIDYVLASSTFVALSAGPDCTPLGSDHCLLTATFARPRTQSVDASGMPLPGGGRVDLGHHAPGRPAWHQ